MRGVARVHLRLSTLHAKVDRINAAAIGLWTIHRRSIHRASSRLTSFHKLLVIMSTRLEYMIIIKDAMIHIKFTPKTQVDASHITYVGLRLTSENSKCPVLMQQNKVQ